MKGSEWRAEAKRELAAQAAQRRRQPHRPRARGVQAISGAGMVRRPAPHSGSVLGMEEQPEPVPAEVADTVHRFTRLVWGESNLRGAWPLVDSTLRQCWTQQWLYPIRDQARANGYDPDEVVAAFLSTAPDHPLWEPFERTQLRQLASWGDLDKWSSPQNRRRVTDDVDLVILMPTAPPGGVIPPGGLIQGLSVLVRQTREGWRILNLSSDHVIPEPGWPPRLA